jgi:hypothetical protein
MRNDALATMQTSVSTQEEVSERNAAAVDWGLLLEPAAPRGNARRADGVASVVDASPSSVHDRSHDGLRPIDTLTAQILMKEERLKYLQRQRRRQRGRIQPCPHQNTVETDQQQDEAEVSLSLDLDDTWECARLVVVAHGASSASSLREDEGADHHRDNRGLPMIHACLRAPDAPTALLERSLRRYPEQLRQPDPRGNLPLHHASARILRPRRAVASAGACAEAAALLGPASEEADEDEGEDVLPRIYSLYPDAARIQNSGGEWPVTVAIRAGRPWRDVSLLAAAHPKALLDLDCHRDRLPLILDGLARRARESGENDGAHPQRSATIAFRLLRSAPDLVPSP